MLAYYDAARLRDVEINGSVYRMPKASVLEDSDDALVHLEGFRFT